VKRALALILVLVAGLASAQFYGYKETPQIGQSRVATDATNAGTRVDQKLNDFVSLDTPFTDDKGKAITLRDVVKDKPVVLLPIFYQCPGVCTNELDQMLRTLQGFKKDNVGDTFDVVVVSIDHTETAELAAKKKELYVDFYENTAEKVKGRTNTKDGWHFLVGSEQSVQKLTDEIGFRFYRDKRTGNIVHPAALVVLTPHGKISRYFLTTEYPQRVLLDSLRAAALENVGVRDDRPFYLACVHVDPLTGQRSLDILNVVKTAGMVTLFVLIGSIASMTIRHRRQVQEDAKNV
jgi:protein SCO1/2